MQSIRVIAGTPSVWVGLLVLAGLSLLSARALGRRCGSSRLLAALAVASVGVILLVTLYPAGPLGHFPQNCAGTLLAFPGVRALFATPDGLLNVLLFLPAGLLVSLVTGRSAATTAGLAMLSFTIEVAQGVMGNHSCSNADWWANSLGALLGAAVVKLARARAAGRRTIRTAAR